MHVFPAAILLALPLALSQPHLQPTTDTAPPPPHAHSRPSNIVAGDLGTKLDQLILSEQLGQFWGQVLVAKSGTIILAKGYGLANKSGQPLDSLTLMDVGSIAKQFTAAAILKLEEQGKLTTEDLIAKFFPSPPTAEGIEFDTTGPGGKITLYHLLTHTSGLSDSKGAIQRLNFPDRDQAVRLALNSPLNHEPGEAFEYCNGGYVILGAVIEKASGRPFESFLRDELFTPAGLTSTGFLDGEGVDLENAAARVLESQGSRLTKTILQDGWGWGFKGCGGVLTNVVDLLAWDRALRTTTILDKPSLAKLYTPFLADYALGWRVGFNDSGRIASHSGRTRGFSAVLFRDLEDDLVVAVLTNERNDATALAILLRNTMLTSAATKDPPHATSP